MKAHESLFCWSQWAFPVHDVAYDAFMTLPPYTSSSREDDVRLERRNALTLGPQEFLVVGFEGNHFTGQILPELHAAREKGIIRLVDLLFVTKGESGNTQVMELSDLSDEEATPYALMTQDLLGLLTMEAIEQAANDIPNNRTAAITLIEPVWAIGLNEAVRNAGGVVFAWGLWTLKRWAFWATVMLEILNIAGLLTSWMQHYSSFGFFLFSLVIPVIILVYFLADHNVRQAFGM